MLLGSILIVFIFIANAQAFDIEEFDIDIENGIREKRQSISFRFITASTTKVTIFEFNDQQLVTLSGDGAGTVMVEVNQTIECDTTSGELRLVGNMTFSSDITMCSSITLFSLATINSGSVEFIGPGILYFGGRSSLFIDDQSALISDRIELQRPNFAPLPIEVLVTQRMNDRLVLNLDETPDGDAAGNDDGLILTGSMCTELQGGDSITYNSMTIVVRRRSMILVTNDTIEQYETVTEVVAGGVTCLEIIRSTQSRSGFFSGPGLLCLGISELGGGPYAFFSDSSQTINFIQQSIVNNLFRCDLQPNGAPVLVGNFTPNADVELVLLSEAEFQNFPLAVSKEQDSGVVLVRDQFGIIIREYRCPTGVNFVCFSMNTLVVSDNTGSVSSIDVPAGGLSTVFNPDTCTVFAYPTRNSQLSDFINQCRASSTLTPSPPISFSSRSNSFGSVDIFSGGALILSASSSDSFSIGANQMVSFMDNRVSILNNDQSGTSNTVATFGGISSFTANTASNRLTTVSSGSSFASGPGNLFTDRNGRAFFTNSDLVASFVQRAASSSQIPPVEVVRNQVNTTQVISLQSNGATVFVIGDDTGRTAISGDQCLLFQQSILALSVCSAVPTGGSISYLPDFDFVQITNSAGEVTNITGVSSFFASSTIGGPLSPVSSSDVSSFPGGGIFYQGDAAGSAYLPSDLIDEASFNTLSGLGGLQFIAGNTDDLRFFSSDSGVLIFNGSSRTVSIGPGSLYQSSGNNFYTNNPDLQQRILTDVSRLRPVTSTYNSTTGDVTVFTAGGRVITTFPIGSRRVSIPGGVLTFSVGTVTTSSEGDNFITDGVTRLVFFDGLEVREPNITAVPLPGGGLLVIDETTGSTFYTTDSIAIMRVSRTVTDAVETFIAPTIPRSNPPSFTSTVNTVDAGFGQIVTVFSGSDVVLTCRSGSANPPAEFTFSQRPIDNENFTSLLEGVNVVVETDGVNEAVLRLFDVDVSEVEYRCEATNVVGADFEVTRLIVSQGETTEIVNNFFAGSSSPGERVVTARNDRQLTIIPTLTPTDPTTFISDRSLLTDQVSIGCKASGRPSANITWFRTVAGGPREEVNLSLPNFNTTSEKPGESLLTVALESQDTECFNYICVADNGGLPVEASVQICPQRFEPIGAPVLGVCTVSCGIGFRTSTFQYQRSFNGTIMTVEIDELPSGLVKPEVQFCQESPCPVIDFEFVTGNFSECSEFCRSGGIQTREVTCVRTVDGVRNETVEDEECTEAEQMRPEDTQLCNDRPCPVYRIGSFEPCSQTCGRGVRRRNVTCEMATIDQDSGNFIFSVTEEIDIEFCYNFSMQVQPVEMESCQIQQCLVRYLTSSFGECDSFNCQTRNFSCVFFDPSDPAEQWPADDGLCIENNLIPPHTVRNCNGRDCSFGRMRTESIGTCSTICGIGVQEQRSSCVDVTNPNLPEIEIGFCGSRRPPDEVSCFLQNCPGRCDFEPPLCPLLRRLGLCKSSVYVSITQRCCKSCPFQSTPIPPPIPPPTPELVPTLL